MPPLETGWLHLLTHLISAGQRLVTSYLAAVTHASGKDGASQMGMRIAGYPVPKPLSARSGTEGASSAAVVSR